MLAGLSFNDFYDEFKLKSITDKKLFVLALLDQEKGLGLTQIHKISFLTFAEGKIIIPFKFTKWPHGPFSEGLKDTLDELQKEVLILENPEQIIDFCKKTKIFSEKGKEFLKINSHKIKEIKEEIRETLLNHDEGAISLELYCYKNYFLRPKEQSEEEWDALIKNKIKDLLFILDTRSRDIKNLEEIEEQKRTVILTSFDYVSSLLEKLFFSKEVDEVIKGVLIKSIEEYINKWGGILQLTKDSGSLEEIKSLLLDVRRIFRFINESAERYGVFESVFYVQVTEN